MNYGAAVRRARALRGLSQKELAAAADVNASYISLIEAGRRTPTTSVLEAIAKVLRFPLHLIILLASEDEDLQGISKKEAQALGRQLLEMLVIR